MTGLSSRMAALSSPFASNGVDGATTLRPGRWMNHASGFCEWYRPPPTLPPLGARRVPRAAVPISQRRGLIDDLIEAARNEIGKLHLGHRPVAALRRPDADADDRRFRDRRVDDPRLAELLEEAVGDAEGAAIFADILAQHEDLRIPPHFLEQRFADRFEVTELLRHRDP